MVTIAAASIAFGGDKARQPVLLILIGKLLLAWSILFGVFFASFCCGGMTNTLKTCGVTQKAGTRRCLRPDLRALLVSLLDISAGVGACLSSWRVMPSRLISTVLQD
jgi:hypothetical protein